MRIGEGREAGGGGREGRGGEEEEKKCRNEWKIMQFTPAPRRVRPVTCTLARQRKLTDRERSADLQYLQPRKKWPSARCALPSPNEVNEGIAVLVEELLCLECLDGDDCFYGEGGFVTRLVRCAPLSLSLPLSMQQCN